MILQDAIKIEYAEKKKQLVEAKNKIAEIKI